MAPATSVNGKWWKTDLFSTANQPIAPYCFSWTAHGYLRQQITTYDTPKFDKFCWL